MRRHCITKDIADLLLAWFVQFFWIRLTNQRWPEEVTQLAYKQYVIEQGIEYHLCTWGREDPYDFWGIQGLPNIILVNGKTGSLMADVQEDIFYSQLLDDDPEQIRSKI